VGRRLRIPRRRTRAALLGMTAPALLLPRLCLAAQTRQLEVGLESFAYESATTPSTATTCSASTTTPASPGWRSAGASRTAPSGPSSAATSSGRGARRSTRPAASSGRPTRSTGGARRWGCASGSSGSPGARASPGTRRTASSPPRTPSTRRSSRRVRSRRGWTGSRRPGRASSSCSDDGRAPATSLSRRPSRRAATPLALRSRFVVKDTDVALVVSGGKNQRTLFGSTSGATWMGRRPRGGGPLRGAEMLPPRDDTMFFRIVAGALRTSGENAFALEYFYNGEGYSDAGTDRWLAGLDQACRRSRTPPFLPSCSNRRSPSTRRARRSPTRAASACAATTSTRPGRGAGRPRSGRAPCARSSPRRRRLRAHAGRGLGAAGQRHAERRRGAAPRPEESEYRLAPVRGALQARLKVLF